MKNILSVLLFSALLTSCEDFLSLEPLGQLNSDNYMNTEENAVTVVNAMYDLLGQSEGKAPDGRWLDHHYEFFMGSMITDDSEKGSKPSDGGGLIELLNWSISPNTTLCNAFWIHGFWGISRANYVLNGLKDSSIDEDLKNRMLGEAYFMRGYWYFYLLRHYGGVPLIEEPLQPSMYGKLERASLHETLEQAIKDFKNAIDLLPEKSEYSNVGIFS